MKPKQRSFYEEMDQSHSAQKEKTLSFWKLGLFFLALIVVCEVILFLLGRGIRSKPDTEFAVRGAANLGSNLVSQNEAGGEVQTVISQGALCSKLVERSKKEVSCSIDQDGIMISGKISPLLPQNTTAYVKPKVVAGKVKFDVEKVTVGSFAVARFVAYPLSSALSLSLGGNLQGVGEITKIDLEPAVMVIVSKTQ